MSFTWTQTLVIAVVAGLTSGAALSVFLFTFSRLDDWLRNRKAEKAERERVR